MNRSRSESALTAQGYMPQLDALRALAMAGVLFIHFWGRDRAALEDLRVNLFFMVSGFLITRMLWRAKTDHKRYTACAFFARRSLRLLPALYIALTVAWMLDMAGIRQSYLWHVLQLSNVYFLSTHHWRPWVTAHLWSLNVIEQFYLFWLAAMLLLPRPWILPLTFMMIVVGWVYSPLVTMCGFGPFTKKVMPFAYGDVIGMGCLLALYEVRKNGIRRLPHQEWIVLGAIVLLMLPLFFEFFPHELYRLVSPLALLAIVHGAAAGVKGPIGWVLSNGAIRYLGRISYGVFIYHFFVLWVLFALAPTAWWLELGPNRFLSAGAITILFSALSWHLVERPVASLKRFVPLVPGVKDAAGPHQRAVA